MKRMSQGLGLCISVVGCGLLYGLQVVAPASVGLLVVAALALVAGVLLCVGLSPKAQYEATFSSSGIWLALSALGGILMIGGNGYALVSNSMDKVVALAGLVAGVSILAVSMGRYRGSVMPFAVHILPCLSLVVKLIVEFRQWSVDPTIMDYLFRQLAVIAAMAANLHIAGYCYHIGKRRTTAFLTLATVVFTGASLPGSPVCQALVTAGMGAWMLANLGQVLDEEVLDIEEEVQETT